MDQLKQRLLSGLHDCKARTADKYWVTIPTRSTPKVHAGQNLYFSPPAEGKFSVCQQRGDLVFSNLGFFIFPAVFSHHPFIGAQVAAASFPPISPNALRTPLQCISVHCIALQYTAARTVIYLTNTLSTPTVLW